MSNNNYVFKTTRYLYQAEYFKNNIPTVKRLFTEIYIAGKIQ